MVWGGWLVVTGLTFSLMAGIIHPYYMVVLAPPIARARRARRGGARGGDRDRLGGRGCSWRAAWR